MNPNPSTAPIDSARAASLLAWWIEAGVDVAVAETPRDWLRPAAPILAAAAPAAPTLATLAAYQSWLAQAPGLPLDRPGARRIVPTGNEAAPLMLLTDLPDADRAIGGEAWQLTMRMMAAIAINPADAYVAALACFHAPGARIARDDLERCGAMARDHIRLAAPERLLLLGDAPARALIGQPLQAARGKVHRIEGVRAVATFHPRWLLQRPSDKALAWRDMLLLMSEEG